MSEQEWEECDNVEPMLGYVCGKVSPRKLRLFAVACSRRILSQLDERWVEVVERYEQYADREVKRKEMLALIKNLLRLNSSISRAAQACCSWGCSPEWTPSQNATAASVYAADTLAENDPDNGTVHLRWTPTWKRERSWQATLARDVFGNPFRKLSVKRAGFTATAVSLATAIYNERAFDRLPILADALEDAGCDNADMLNHCRQPGDHVRGCWCVDLLLGRS